MGNTVIRVEDIGKLYRLGEIGTGTLSHDLNRWFAKVRGKEDPLVKIGETNDRTSKGSSEYVWALKDVNFEVKQGEVLGIIGRNGAGKSTLLKILSKVTTPTTGRIKVKGRIASLLEVGTGFHPELTGRENIFLNGAILGMTKAEIRKKFDEIVDFAGIERYIDTPVKRYSSGMYVRLAFAVAAFLEPEILIVDEVLAVGDAEFQKKCLGRMRDVSTNDGRTVLFVSHNMAAVKMLCNKAIVLQNGSLGMDGTIESAINFYQMQGSSNLSRPITDLIIKRHSSLSVQEVEINGSSLSQVDLNKANRIQVSISGNATTALQLNIELRIFTTEGILVSFYSPGHMDGELKSVGPGNFVLQETVTLPEKMVNGEYQMSIQLSYPNVETYLNVENIQLLKTDISTVTGRSLNYNEIGFVLMERYDK